MAISSERHERFAAYAASHVWFDHPTLGALVVEPQEAGVTSGVFPGPSGAMIYIVTAHNPGRLLDADENAARHRRLAAEVAALDAVTAWRALGGDPAWQHTEECLAIVGLDDESATALGRQFDQEAIYAWDECSWRLLACRGGSVSDLGWRTERWQGSRPPG